GTAAQFDRPAQSVAAARGCRIFAHRNDAHLVAVFFAEQGASAGGDSVVTAHQPRDHRAVLQNEVIGDVFDALDLLAADCLWMREVEAQPVRRDQRAFLRDVIAEYLAQSLVKKMRRRMVFADRAAAGVIDLKRQRGAGFHRAFFDGADMRVEVAGIFLRVGDLETNTVGRHDAGVADLAAGFTIEPRLIEDHAAAFAFFHRTDSLAVAQDGGNPALGALGLVAEKFGSAELLPQRKPGRSRRGFAGTGP